MEQIESGIYIENAFTGVTLGALALPHGTILIDAPPCPDDARSWRAALRNLGSGVNRLLINLDEHYDRTLGARTLECAVMSHTRTAQLVRGRSAVFKGQVSDSGAEWERCSGLSGIRWAPPDLTFNQQALLHWKDTPVVLEHHPGPSPGAAWVMIPDLKVVFVGDTVPINQPPFLANANLPNWIESMELLLSTAFRDYLVVSGRGGPAPVEVLKGLRRTLKYLHRRMEALAGREERPEATEALIPKLLSGLDFPPEREEQYIRRLRYGLSHYYTRVYRPTELEEEE